MIDTDEENMAVTVRLIFTTVSRVVSDNSFSQVESLKSIISSQTLISVEGWGGGLNNIAEDMFLKSGIPDLPLRYTNKNRKDLKDSSSKTTTLPQKVK